MKLSPASASTIGTAVAAAVASGVALVVLWTWLNMPAQVALERRDPVRAPARGQAGNVRETPVDLRGVFQRFAAAPAAIARSATWPQFRGAQRDNIVAETVPLAEHWGADGPPRLWSIDDLGEGHAGPVVHDGHVYLLDYDEKARTDALRCFALADGRELWRRAYAVQIKRNHGMSRTTPAVTDRFVVSVGPKGHVLCVEPRTGEFLWGIDLVAEFATRIPLWYTGQCPLVDGDVVVLAPAGDAMMIGVDGASGSILWRTPNLRNWQMSHASVMPMTLAGRRQYVYTALGGVVGVAADGPERGTVLWESMAWNSDVVAPSPVAVDGERLFLTAGYGTGSMMLRVTRDAGSWVAEPLFSLDRSVFACEQQTPILYAGHLFGILPNDAGPRRREFVCLDLDGNPVWNSGPATRFGLGPFLVADGKMFILNDDGVLTLIRASVAGYEPLAQARVLTGRDAWAPMALVDGRLLLRDSTRLVCLDVRAAPSSPQAPGQ